MPKIQNRARLKRKLNALPQAIKDKIRPAMAAGADRIVEVQGDTVPVDTGRLQGSIGWVWGDPPRHVRLGSNRGNEPDKSVADLKISIYAGDELAYYARWVEFGTRARAAGAYRDESGHARNAGTHGHRATPAKPFFFGPYRLLRKSVAQSIGRAVNQACKDVAKIQ